MSERQQYTIEAQITCVRRELAMRKNVYPKWVQSGRMKAEAADHEINCMQAVHDSLTQLIHALEQSVRLQSHYAVLLNVYDGGTRIQFKTADEWLDRLACLGGSPPP